MSKTIDYYLSPVSPWTYFGHDRLVAIARKHGASVNLKPIDLGRIFPISGGLPLAKRAPQRQAYRLYELARWRDFLKLPINIQPKFGAILHGRWAQERDIADPVTLAELAQGAGLEATALAARAASPEIAARSEALTQEAIDAQVFGAPWYVYGGEPFWGQDRLDFLDRALSK
jgi:2-hydroxychromene-2-carboxylate isomerase